MPIFEKIELEDEFQFAKDVLPTNNDVLKYVLSGTGSKKGDKNSHVREMARLVVDMWEKADCCPHSILRVTQLFEQLQQSYLKYLIKSAPNGGKNKHRKRPSTSPPPQPSSKSSRQSSPLASLSPSNIIKTSTPPTKPVIPTTSPLNTPKSTRSNPDHHILIRKQWDAEYGSELFDILHRDRIMEIVKRGGAFDNQFYEDQSSSRNLIMQVHKVTNEFKQSEVRRLQKEARHYAREMSAKGLDLSENIEIENESLDEPSGHDNSHDKNFETPLSSQGPSSIIETRNKKKRLQYIVTTCDEESQTDDFSINTTVRDKKDTRIVQPEYSKALSLMMAEGLSAAEAVKCGFIWDTEVYEQKRLLPLALDKDYINMKAKLKKLSGESTVANVNEEPDVEAEVQVVEENSEDIDIISQDSKM